jgi:hypothetical protein
VYRVHEGRGERVDIRKSQNNNNNMKPLSLEQVSPHCSVTAQVVILG